VSVRAGFAGAAVALVALSPLSARANGRFPQANQLVGDPSDPARLVARTTFGLLLTSDGGATWRWVCEDVVGFTGTFDPAITLSGSGALLAGLPDGLSHSSTFGCTWAKSTALGKEWIVDLAGDRIDTHHVVAVNAPVDLGVPGFQAFVAHSRDDGLTWSLAAGRLPEDVVPTTVDVSPSRPQRLYASGVGAFRAFASVLRSDDAGATWAESTFDMGGATAPYLAGVSIHSMPIGSGFASTAKDAMTCCSRPTAVSASIRSPARPSSSGSRSRPTERAWRSADPPKDSRSRRRANGCSPR